MDYCPDLNRDGFVNFADVAILRRDFSRAWEALTSCQPVITLEVSNRYTDGTEIRGPIKVTIREVSPGCYQATVTDSAGVESEPSEEACRSSP